MGMLEDLLDRRLEGRRGLAGDVVEQIEGAVLDPGPPGRLDGVEDVCRAMPTAQSSELRSVEALGAEADPGHAGRSEAGQVATLVWARVGLDGHLGAGRKPEAVLDPLQERADHRRGQERRRAAAEVDGGERTAPRVVQGTGRSEAEARIKRVGAELELGLDGSNERLQPSSRAARRMTRVDDEVAVRAERDAERDVHVEPDRRLAQWSDSPTTSQPSGGRLAAKASSGSWPGGLTRPA